MIFFFFNGTPDSLETKIWNQGLSLLGRSHDAFPIHKLTIYTYLGCFHFLWNKGFSTVDENSEAEYEVFGGL